MDGVLITLQMKPFGIFWCLEMNLLARRVADSYSQSSNAFSFVAGLKCWKFESVQGAKSAGYLLPLPRITFYIQMGHLTWSGKAALGGRVIHATKAKLLLLLPDR